MKAMEVIERVDLLEPNDYSPEQKLHWLSTLDGKAFRELVETHEGAEITELPAYVNGGEELLINKRMTMFNAAYQEWTDFYNRTHKPKRAGAHFLF